MSWRDRDYSRVFMDGVARRIRTRPWSRRPARTFLTTLHVVLPLLLLLAGPNPYVWRALQSWTAATHAIDLLIRPFFVDNLLGMALTVLGIWIVGGRVEEESGAPRLLAHYAFGALLGAGAFGLVRSLAPFAAAMPMSMPVGPLAAIAFAAWRRTAYEKVVIFGRMTSFRSVLLISAGVGGGLMLLGQGFAAGGWISAVIAGVLGSVALDVTWARFGSRWRRPRTWIAAERSRAQQAARGRPAVEASIREKGRVEPDAEIDDLLAKISRAGVASLAPEEHARLEAARQAKLKREPTQGPG